jgi:hypothetical protein
MEIVSEQTPWEVGIQLAFLCVAVGGVVAAGIALTLASRTRSTKAAWSSAWHTPFTFAFVFQMCSVILAIPLFVGAAVLSTELWIPGLLLVNALWTASGVVCWRRLRLTVVATTPPSIIQERL